MRQTAYRYLQPGPGAAASPSSLLQVASADNRRLASELRESQRRYEALFNNRTQAITHLRMLTDAAGRVVNYRLEAINDAYERLVGVRRADIEGRLATEAFPGIENLDFDFREPYATVAMQGSEAQFERFFAPIGRWFSVYAYSPAAGECIVIFTDVTDKKHAEATLRESEQVLRAAFEQAQLGMTHISAEGRVTLVNHKFCELLGYTEDELLRMRFADFTHPEDRHVGMAEFEQSVRGELSGFSFEKRYRRRDGTSIWARVSVAAVRHQETGAWLYNLAIVEDITAAKAAEAEREQLMRDLQRAAMDASRSHAQLAAVFEAIDDGVSVFDMQGNLVMLNTAMARINAFDSVQEMQRNLEFFARFYELHQPDGRRLPVERWPVSRVLRGESFHDWELRASRLDVGKAMDISYSGAPVHDENGRQVLGVVIMRDISARKTLERDLQQAHRDLEFRVELRTAELQAANEALSVEKEKAEAARRAAEQANRAKSDFLAIMSHEIRTPLNGVIGFNGLLLDGPLTEAKRPYAELARQSGESLLHLLNDFLDFSKIEAGHLELEPIEFDPRVEISNALSLVRDQARRKALKLVTRIAVPDSLRGDAARLRQILLNLLSNAVKFTGEGTVTVSCSELARDAGRCWLVFEVSDTGIGIAPTARARLFQPFSQADASTTRRFGGTGLGLAICKRLCEAMGGRIGVTSVAGEGSTFRVELPFEIVTGSRLADDVHLPQSQASVGTLCRGRVLVVEDNPVSQLLAGEMLKRLGCRVDVAGNGQEAVEAMRRLPYDLVFMDCDMPVMNGFDATRQIRADEAQRPRAGSAPVPIVAITASALKGDSERCLAVGMDDFMSKPIRLEEMQRMVERWLGGR